MMSNNANPMKKRKANDGRATTDGAHDVHRGNTNDGGGFLSSWFGYFSGRSDDALSSGPSRDENSTSQLDRMENIMMRMEENLATVSSTVDSLESRCEQLEAKCSSLENMLESTSQSTKEHIDKAILESTSRTGKTLNYHEMMIKNQNWKYPTYVYTMNDLADAEYTFYEAEYIHETSQMLKTYTEALRRGDFPVHEGISQGNKGIHLIVDAEFPSIEMVDDAYDILAPHWKEFAAALKHFKPAFDVFPDDCETSIAFKNVKLDEEMTHLVKDALMNMPFKINDGQQQMFTIAELSSAIHRHPSLVDVAFDHCFTSGSGLGDEMLHSLLGTDNLKLERLSMPNSHLLGFHNGFNVCTLLSDYLATNPRLKELNLNDNNFDDSDAFLIANALRSNTTLRHLYIDGNQIGDDGAEALKRALYNGSSLNSVSDSNHHCYIDTDYFMMLHNMDLNESEDREINRAHKIYYLLSSRNKTMTNVQDFGDIDVKLLPNILEIVQKYSRSTGGDNFCVEALSIVYEIMRRWDEIYKALGNSGR
eukprot:scaffold834_cov144-Skeletonema_marinoi.AAC.8